MQTGQPLEERNVRIRDAHYDFMCAPLSTAAGACERVMMLCVDVSDRVAARREAEAANRTKDEFMAVLGHELRNPLAPIVTALHLMKLRPAAEQFQNERNIIERQVRHMVRLVDDLLDVSRITRGKIQLRKKRVELYAIVAKALEAAGSLLETRRHHLEMNMPRSGLHIDVDEDRMTQVISNLLNNAAKYTEPGGTITLTGAREDDRAVLKISDTGIGIKPELIENLFHMFVQGERAMENAQGGLGLGLAIAKTLTTLHGGDISARSGGPGKGSEFTISLPVAPHRPAPGPVLVTREKPAPSFRRRKILVVDDNRDAAEALAIALETQGHQVKTAFDGIAALQAVPEFRADIVLLDIGLPVMDGYEVAQKLRLMPGGDRLRIVAVSGYGQESDRERSKRAGFDMHVVKPIDLNALDDILGLTAA
jgi:signal transduction histidine kinase